MTIRSLKDLQKAQDALWNPHQANDAESSHSLKLATANPVLIEAARKKTAREKPKDEGSEEEEEEGHEEAEDGYGEGARHSRSSSGSLPLHSEFKSAGTKPAKKSGFAPKPPKPAAKALHPSFSGVGKK